MVTARLQDAPKYKNHHAIFCKFQMIMPKITYVFPETDDPRLTIKVYNLDIRIALRIVVNFMFCLDNRIKHYSLSSFIIHYYHHIIIIFNDLFTPAIRGTFIANLF